MPGVSTEGDRGVRAGIGQGTYEYQIGEGPGRVALEGPAGPSLNPGEVEGCFIFGVHGG